MKLNRIPATILALGIASSMSSPAIAQTGKDTICPTQEVPEMPRRAVRQGISGLVRAELRIVDGVVRDVAIVSGPRIFHEEVIKAATQYKCLPINYEVIATQEFVFKLD